MRSDNWLRQRLQEVGIPTSAELARLLELEGLEYTAGAVAHWVNGTRNPRLQNPQLRQTLARVLRLSERELMMRAGYELARTGRSEAAQIAAEIIDNLPPDKQDLAVRLLEQLRAS